MLRILVAAIIVCASSFSVSAQSTAQQNYDRSVQEAERFRQNTFRQEQRLHDMTNRQRPSSPGTVVDTPCGPPRNSNLWILNALTTSKEEKECYAQRRELEMKRMELEIKRLEATEAGIGRPLVENTAPAPDRERNIGPATSIDEMKLRLSESE